MSLSRRGGLRRHKPTGTDRVPPRGRILTPANGEVIRAETVVVAQCHDNVAVSWASLRFFATHDPQNPEFVLSLTPATNGIFTSTIDPTLMPDGTKEVELVVSDGRNEIVAAAISVLVAKDDIPEAIFISPTQGATISGQGTVTVAVTSPVYPLRRVVLKVDGSDHDSDAVEDTGPPYSGTLTLVHESSGENPTTTLSISADSAVEHYANIGSIEVINGGYTPPATLAPTITSVSVNDSTITEGDSATFSVTTSGGQVTTHRWEIPNSSSGTPVYNVASPVVPFNEAGTWSGGTVTVSNQHGSDTEVVPAVTVAALPSAPSITSLSFTPTTVSVGDSVTATVVISGTATALSIDLDGDGVANGSTTTVTPTTTITSSVNVPGTHTPTATVTGPGGSDTDSSGGTLVVTISAGETFLQSHTARNLTGSTQAKPPVKWVLKLDPGELTTAETLVLRLGDETLVPTTHWQWGERSTFEDGSLRSCVVRCLGPASWTNNTDQQWKVYKKAGAWPAESSSGTVADITGVSNRSIRFANIAKVIDLAAGSHPGYKTNQPAVGSGNYYNALNHALGLAVTFKRTAGLVCDQWSTWSKIRDLVGDAYNDDLWVQHIVEVWRDPDDSYAVKYISWEPKTNLGWCDRYFTTYLYDPEIYQGASKLKEWKFPQTISNTAVNTALDRIAVTAANFPHGATTGGITFGGASPPTGIIAGKRYPGPLHRTSSRLVGYDHFITIRDINTAPDETNSALVHQSPWTPSGGKAFDFVDGGTSNFTISYSVYHAPGRAWILREDDGFEHWILANGTDQNGAGPKIVPNWTRAEKLSRMRRALIRPSDITLGDQGPLHNYAWTKPVPCGVMMSDKAGGFDGPSIDQSTGDVTLWFFDLLRGMTSFGHHRQMRVAALDTISISEAAMTRASLTNPATGLEYAKPYPVSGGPNRSGGNYPNMPPTYPSAVMIDWTRPPTAPYKHFTEADWASPWRKSTGLGAGQNDGSHTMPISLEAYALYASAMDLECCVELYNRAHGFASFLRSRQWAGINYYGVSLLSNGGAISNGRVEGQVARLLAGALYIPDDQPEAQWYRDQAKDSADYIDLAVDTPDILGPVHKARGISLPSTFTTGGGAGTLQTWANARNHMSYLFLYKIFGRSKSAVIDFYTNNSRMWFNDPPGGTPGSVYANSRSWAIGVLGGTEIIRDPDLYLTPATSADMTHATGLQGSLRDHGTPQSTVSNFSDLYHTAENGLTYQAVVFNADNTVTVNEPTATYLPLHANGDEFRIGWTATAKTQMRAIGLDVLRRYFLYDKSGTTYKICTDFANPAATRVTWSGTLSATPVMWKFVGNGRGPNGYALSGVTYTYMISGPLAGAAHWYGRTNVQLAWTNFLEFVTYGGQRPNYIGAGPSPSGYDGLRHNIYQIETT